jgi:YegS C-terminal NAD kinase beta sandwich-like domain
VTVRKGEEWGEAGSLPAGGVVVRTDAAAREVVAAARRAGDRPPPLGLLGGDLCRTLGGRGDEARLRSDAATRLPVDLGSVLVDGVQHWFVAHVVARRSWWRGRIVAAMNAEFLGAWDVAPRAHPNDGLLDVVDVAPAMSLADRVKARGRLATGAHVPHPAIAVSRQSAVQLSFERPTPVWLDGVPVGEARHLSVRLEPDALLCVV